MQGSADEEEKKLKILKAVHFFKPFTDDELKALLENGRWLRYNYGDILFREGDRDDSFYIILKGSVQVMKKMVVSTLKKTIGVLKAGQCFGEMSVIRGESRSADVAAAEETYVLKVDADTLQKDSDSLLLRSVQFKFYKIFCGILAERLNHADSELVKPY